MSCKCKKNSPDLCPDCYDKMERVCAARGCQNYSMSGYIYCVHCLHGAPSKAPKELIELKQRYRGYS